MFQHPPLEGQQAGTPTPADHLGPSLDPETTAVSRPELTGSDVRWLWFRPLQPNLTQDVFLPQ